MVESAMYHIGLLEKNNFHDIIISLKSSNVKMMVEAYRKNDRKSLRYETIKEKGHLIRQGFLPRLHYLEIIDQYYCEVFK